MPANIFLTTFIVLILQFPSPCMLATATRKVDVSSVQCNTGSPPLYLFGQKQTLDTKREGNETTLLSYSFRVQQSVESKFMGESSKMSTEMLTNLTRRHPEGAYVKIFGGVTLRPACGSKRTLGQLASPEFNDELVIEAEFTHLQVECDQSMGHYKECLSKFAPLEVASSKFWFRQSPSTKMVYDIRAPHTDPVAVADFKKSIANIFGVGSGKCNIIRDSQQNLILEKIKRNGGHHGSTRDRQMRFHSMKIHEIALGSLDSGTKVATLILDDASTPKLTIRRAASYGLYALDVHGKTSSGRAMPHHFVHSSSEATLVSAKIRTTPEDKSYLDNNVCSPADFQSSFDLGKSEDLSFLSSNEALLHEQSTQVDTNIRLKPKDIAKFVARSISMITGARDKIKKGSMMIGKTINDLDDLRITLLDDDVSSACKMHLFDGANEEPGRLRSTKQGSELWCICNLRESRQILTSDECLEPKYTHENPLLTENAKLYDRSKFCKWDTSTKKCMPLKQSKLDSATKFNSEMGEPSLMAQGINALDTLIRQLEIEIKEAKIMAKNFLDKATDKSTLDHLYTKLSESLCNGIAVLMDKARDFFLREIGLQLSKMKEFIPTIVKNIRPLSELLANIMNTLAPTIKTAKKIAERVQETATLSKSENSTIFLQSKATERPTSPDITLLSIPKGLAAQWTQSKSYKKLFSPSVGLLPLFIKLLDFADKDLWLDTKTQREASLKEVKLKDEDADFDSIYNDISLHSKADKLSTKSMKTGNKAAKQANSASQIADGLEMQLVLWLQATADDTSNFIDISVKNAFEKLKVELRNRFNVYMDIMRNETLVDAADLAQKLKTLILGSSNNDSSSIIGKAYLVLSEAKLISKRIELFRRILNKILKEKLSRVRKIHKDTELNVIRQMDRYFDKFEDVFSDGRSFSKRSEYTTGLMKGWVATGYAEATAQVAVIPDMSATARAKIGIDYHILKPERRGSLLEFFIEPSVVVKNVSTVLSNMENGILPKPNFSPPIEALTPMLSVMGGPAIPLSSDPLSILESIFPQVQKRVMEGLSDTSFWFPIITSFVQDHLMKVPSIQNALGGLSSALGGNQRESRDSMDATDMVDDLIQLIQTKRELVCQSAEAKLEESEDLVKAKVKSLADESKKSMVSALRAPWSIIKKILSVLDGVTPHILRVLQVVDENIDKPGFHEIKPILCQVQEVVFSSAEKACNLMDAAVEVVGGTATSSIGVLSELMGEAADAVQCDDNASARYASELSKLKKKLKTRNQTSISSMFSVCATPFDDIVVKSCEIDPVRHEENKERKNPFFESTTGLKAPNFMADIFLFGKMIIPLIDQYEDSLKALKTVDTSKKSDKNDAKHVVLSSLRSMMEQQTELRNHRAIPISTSATMLPSSSLSLQDANDDTEDSDANIVEEVGSTKLETKLSSSGEDAWREVANALSLVLAEVTHSPILALVKHGMVCTGIITTTIDGVTDLLEDFRLLYSDASRILTEVGSADAEKLLSELANFFGKVVAKSEKNKGHLAILGAEFDNCEAAIMFNETIEVHNMKPSKISETMTSKSLEKIHDAQTRISLQVRTEAVSLVKSMKQVVPFLKAPLENVKLISEYIMNALLCARGMIPPVKASVEVMIDLIESGSLEPDTISAAAEQIATVFDGPLRCAAPDLYEPLKKILPSPPKRYSQYLNRMQDELRKTQQEKSHEVKQMADALQKGFPMVRNMVQAGVRVYGLIKKLVIAVRKNAEGLQLGLATGSYSEAVKTIRIFKTGVAEIVLGTRELRSILELLPLDQDTILRIFETAETTMTGIEAGCDQIVELMMSKSMPVPHKSSTRSDEGMSNSMLLMEMQSSQNKRFRHQKSKPSPSSHQRFEEIPAESRLSDMEHRLQMKIDRLEQLQTESTNALKIKLDDIQATTDTIAVKAASSQGLSGGQDSSTASETKSDTEVELRRAASKFQGRLMNMAHHLECPSTHREISRSDKQIAEKEFDLLIEEIRVPPEVTYGIDIKVGILVRAVGSLSVNSITCDCSCGDKQDVPCSEIMKVGPSLSFHIIGTGTASIGVKILKLSGTLSVQIGSLFLNSALNIGRVVKQPKFDINGHRTKKNMCIKELPASETVFGMALTAKLDGEMMAGDFSMGVDVLGFKFRKTLKYSGSRRNLANLCFQPSENAVNIKSLQPQICPAMINPDIIIEPSTVKASMRPDVSLTNKRCSICNIQKEKQVPGWDCLHSNARVLSMAGFTDLPDIKNIGMHFQSLLKHQRRELTMQAIKEEMGYFGPKVIKSLKNNYQTYSEGNEKDKAKAPLIDRLFTSSSTAANLAYTTEIEKSKYANEFRYISNILLCSELVNATGANNLEYSGKIYLQYALNHKLRLRATTTYGFGEQSSFTDRYLTEMNKVRDAASNFFIPFSFRVIIKPIKTERSLNYRDAEKKIVNADGEPGHRSNWRRRKSSFVNWVSQSTAGGSDIEFTMLRYSRTNEALSAAVISRLDCESDTSEKNHPGMTTFLERNAMLNYPPSPADMETDALWTKKRCSLCCKTNKEKGKAGSSKVFVYSGEDNDADNTKRSCRDGSVCKRFCNRMFLKPATDDMCQNFCTENTELQESREIVSEDAKHTRNVNLEFNSPTEMTRSKALSDTFSSKDHQYHSSPKAHAEAGWTFVRCEQCCSNGLGNKKKVYDGESNDPKQLRKCKNGRITHEFKHKKGASDNQCKSYCPSHSKTKSDALVPKSIGKFKNAAKSLREAFTLNDISLIKVDDPYSMSTQDTLTLQMYQSMYKLPDLISEYVSTDWSGPISSHPSKIPMLVLPSQVNLYQVTVDEFGTSRAGSVRDFCERSWIFPKRLKDEYVCEKIIDKVSCAASRCLWVAPGLCRLSTNSKVLGQALPIADLFDHGAPNQIASREICRRLKLFAHRENSFLENGKEIQRLLQHQFPTYSAMRLTAIAELDENPCDIEGNNEEELRGFRTQKCFSCEFTGDNTQGSQRWRCSIEHRRASLIDAMSAISPDSKWADWSLGSISGEGGCPRRAAESKKKYSEASYFRTLMYTQGERMSEYLHARFGIQSEEISSIVLCGEDIRPLTSDVGILEDEIDKDTELNEASTKIRAFGSSCDIDSQEAQCQSGLKCALVADEGKNSEGYTYQCVYSSPDIGEPCYQIKSPSQKKWISNCDVPEGLEDPRKQGVKEATLKCILNICSLIPHSDFEQVNVNHISSEQVSGKSRILCRKNEDCPRKKNGKRGNCIKEPDCGTTYVFSKRDDKCSRSHHKFPNDAKSTQLGLCEATDTLMLAIKDNYCIHDSECKLSMSRNDADVSGIVSSWWKTTIGERTKGQGKCTSLMHCVFTGSIPTCKPCERTEVAFDALPHERVNSGGTCDGSRKIEMYCKTCTRDEDCKGYDPDDPLSVRCGAPWLSHLQSSKTDTAFGTADEYSKKYGHNICRLPKEPGELCNYNPNSKKQKVIDSECLYVPEAGDHVSSKQDKSGCRLLPESLKNQTGGRCMFPLTKTKDRNLCLHDDECPSVGKHKCDISRVKSGKSNVGICLEKNAGGNGAHIENDGNRYSRCSEQLQEEWPNKKLRSIQWQYSGIVYFNLKTTRRLEDLDAAQDQDDPSVFSMGFNLKFSLFNIAQGNFLMSVDDNKDTSDESKKFMMPMSEICGTFPNSEIQVEAAETNPFFHLCTAQNAYRSVYWSVAAARRKERTERNPCRLDPEIEQSSYIKPESQYYFHGFQIGPHTVDGSNSIRSNKRCYVCSPNRVNTYGKDEDQGFLSKMHKRGRSFGSTYIHREIDYRCKIDHTGVRYSDISDETERTKGQSRIVTERVAALDLFDEDDVKKDRARQALDAVIESVLKLLYSKHVNSDYDVNKVEKNAEGGFWAQVASDQLGQGQEHGKWGGDKFIATVAICDEVGMSNIKVKMPGIGRTEQLYPHLGSSTEIYGGTLCARIGFHSHCIQYSVPFDDVMKAQYAKERGGKNVNAEADSILNQNMKIWYGENMRPQFPSSSFDLENDGHAYFFQVFLSALQNNFNEKSDLAKCLAKDDLQTPESVPLEDCANRDQICNPPPLIHRKTESSNVREGARCDANPLGGDDTDMIYAQRFVDPDSCTDLLSRHTVKSTVLKVRDDFIYGRKASRSNSKIDKTVGHQHLRKNSGKTKYVNTPSAGDGVPSKPDT